MSSHHSGPSHVLLQKASKLLEKEPGGAAEAIKNYRRRHEATSLLPPSWKGTFRTAVESGFHTNGRTINVNTTTKAQANVVVRKGGFYTGKRKNVCVSVAEQSAAKRAAAAGNVSQDDEHDDDDDEPNDNDNGIDIDDPNGIQATDIRIQDWVHVNSGDPKNPWYGRVTSINRTNKTVCVRWLAPASKRLSPVGTKPLFTYKGGSHHVEISTLNEVSHGMFHAAGPLARQGYKADGAAVHKARHGPSKQLLYCMKTACSGCLPETEEDQKPAKAKQAVVDLDDEADKEWIKWQTNVSGLGIHPNHLGFQYSAERVLRGDARNCLFKVDSKGKLVDSKKNRSSEADAPDEGGAKYEIEPRIFAPKCACRGIAKSVCAVAKEESAAKKSSKGKSSAASKVTITQAMRESCPTWQVHTGAVPRPILIRPTGSRGYGVFAGEDIPKGSFIVEYVGELLSNDLARKREKNYTHFGLFYLHDVPAGASANPNDTLTIDPTLFGNVGRMFNHCCEPNMTTLEMPAAIEASTVVSTIPRVGFFARVDIAKGSELSIDYCPGRKVSQMRKVERCACGSEKCRGWVW
ncbi:histone-lysine N-methyltransferase [Pycnococcus provasolii]